MIRYRRGPIFPRSIWTGKLPYRPGLRVHGLRKEWEPKSHGHRPKTTLMSRLERVHVVKVNRRKARSWWMRDRLMLASAKRVLARFRGSNPWRVID